MIFQEDPIWAPRALAYAMACNDKDLFCSAINEIVEICISVSNGRLIEFLSFLTLPWFLWQYHHKSFLRIQVRVQKTIYRNLSKPRTIRKYLGMTFTYALCPIIIQFIPFGKEITSMAVKSQSTINWIQPTEGIRLIQGIHSNFPVCRNISTLRAHNSWYHCLHCRSYCDCLSIPWSTRMDEHIDFAINESQPRL